MQGIKSLRLNVKHSRVNELDLTSNPLLICMTAYYALLNHKKKRLPAPHLDRDSELV